MHALTWLRGSSLAHPHADVLWPRAVAGGRAAATALALAVFVAGVTLDDLRLFRFSSALVGGVLGAAIFAFAPPFIAGRLLSRALEDAPEAPGGLLEGAVMRRRALLGLTVALLVIWLVFFSSGRTPRW